MRKSYLLYAMGAGLAFSACSSEENLPESNPVLEKDKSFYVNVAITTNADMGGTRANSADYNGTGNPDFEKGEDSESVVNNAYFVFYDANGLVVGQPVGVSTLGDGTAVDETGNILRSYTSVVRVDVNRGESAPKFVMCYLNPVSTDGLASSLQRVETITREGIKDAKGAFAMSNSVYYANNETGTSLTRAVAIGDGQLFDSKEKAEAAVGNNPDAAARVVINVERYAAKVKFSFGKEDVVEAYTPADDNVTLTFVPEKWEVNAFDKKTFVTKAFRADDGLGSPAGTNMSYGQVVDELARGTGWAWNAPINKRSYWAFSPAYYSNEYPYNANDVKGNEDAYALKYLSYNEIVAESNELNPSTTETVKYTNETTVSREGLNSSNPAAAIASVVLAGHYEVTVAGVAQALTPTFYTVRKMESDKPLVLFDAKLQDGKVTSTITGTNTIIEYLVDKESALLVRTGEEGSYEYTPLTKDNLASVFDALEVVRPVDDVFEGLGEYAASRKVTLQIGDLNKVTAGTTLCINLGNGPQVIGNNEGEVSVLEANKALVTAASYADMYNEGKAYFNIPIRHLGWYAGNNPNATSESIDYSAARVGDFGLVRNHVYNILVNSISGLATAIANPNDPIVPPVETKDYYVAYRLNILNWAIVPVQKVDL